MLTGARLGDRFGRRRIHLTRPAGFVAASALAAAAAMMVPQVLATLQVEFPSSERTLGCSLMATGMVLITATADRYAGALEPWHPVPGMVVSGLGMAMVADTPVNIVLAKVPRPASGSASALDGGDPPADAAVTGLWSVVALYVLAGLSAYALPPGRIEPAGDNREDDQHNGSAGRTTSAGERPRPLPRTQATLRPRARGARQGT
ncbi:hypothetical protein ACFV0Z_18400 [Streptomyces xiamenensis]|uniref:hypothetical protein n=1 Tax=Streptomyces xiamenensis TaxID=408015 RepID=UPI0036C7166C